MLCFLKRILPFTLTLVAGLAIGGFFNLFSSSPRSQPARAYKWERAYYGYSGGGGCRSRRYFAAADRPAEILYRPEALYTDAARRNATQGDVTLRLTLGADGNVRDIETITSLPDGLTEQARRAAREIRFNPALRDGSPVDEVQMMTYSFNID
jgi:TonB family protein